MAEEPASEPTARRSRRRRVATVVSAVFYLALLVFLVQYLRSIDYQALSGVSVGVPALLGATVVSLSFRFWGAYTWRVILLDLGAVIRNNAELVYIYAKSWLGRYLPGKVTWILGKIYFASQQGIGKKRLAVSATAEAALQIAVTLALSLACLAVSGGLAPLDPPVRVFLLVAAGVLVVGLHPAVFNVGLGLVYRAVRRQRLDIRVSWSTIAKGAGLYSVSVLLAGVSYYLFVESLYPSLSPSEFLYVVGAFNLAGIIGVLAVFAPSGLGVREAVQLLLLVGIMPPEVALVVTVASRVWSTAVDGLFFLVARGLRWWANRSRRAEEAMEPL